ncbi:MAG TPA: ATP-dependent zinc metalloprotease FtsH [Candidatus Avimonoglobus intestinipullorum]|uniref:ATP-dependent zinc metalloprotease FtsH n=1 Tax=Candidatus Avimonoglobus intestinipullorum TaxID=2840699 RepID=A0A9D1S5I7_9FIRM|nr:ATP-dependent zinc metalloprotease FtsH [Candidatus Avimonoglobus intestinipullorum]
MNDKKPNNQKKPSLPRNPFFMFLLLSIVFTVLLNSLLSYLLSPQEKEIYYSEFIQMVKNDEVEEVQLSAEKIVIYKKEEQQTEQQQQPQSGFFMFPSLQQEQRNLPQIGGTIYYTGNIGDPDLYDLLDEHGVKYTRPVTERNAIVDFFLTWILPFGLMYLLVFLLMRFLTKKMGGGGGFMSVGQSNAKIYMENKTGVTFKDVAGQEEAKESLDEIVDFLHNPAKYTAIGAKQPKGALLVGPPGTGKTLLAKAVAGEANVPFFSLSGSEFVEMFVGVGASRVRDLFKQAADKAPCIIFIDEIDAIGKSRDNAYGGGGNDEREQTLNQLLAEMDGFDSSKGVVILAATNRPEILDKALLRPGRFDRRIIVEKPDLKGREDILKVHSKDVRMSKDVDLHEIALATSGAVGADLANMVNEAALRAVRFNRTEVLQEDLMEAVEVIIAGKEKKDRILSEKEKQIVAYHEVGHALATALQKHTDPVQKITIVPRTKGSLGYTLSTPEEEHYLISKDEIESELVILLAGRAAEELVFNTKTTGAANDIERASELARNMITQYGMSDKFGMIALESLQNKYLDGRSVSNCSEETQTQIDNEVIALLKTSYEKAQSLLRDNMDALKGISEYLIEKETITGKQFMEIFNQYQEQPKLEAAPETSEE